MGAARHTVYRIVVDEEARAELTDIQAFYRRPVVQAIRLLAHLAETETRNRKPLAEPLDLLPDATWECRVGVFRVLYRVEERTARVLRVIIKSGTTGESL
jgi:mRNA-degrading endonuclease RelE of RelBE toxin-antitoxin system